uniref:SKA complex subunit 1 n=1 Tax=Hucho hucho TaxID=62062 RepID=A0A4W5PB49_9TELE
MSHCEFEDIILHLNDRISSIRQCLELQTIAKYHDKVNMPRKGQPAVHGRGPVRQSGPVDVQPTQQEHLRKTSKKQIRDGIHHLPRLNASVESINTAVTGKYCFDNIWSRMATWVLMGTNLLPVSILLCSLTGVFFIVEADIKEFTRMKVDKRFQGILSMLRHCQRLREQRGGGITRYVLL